jgi:hypothetical protein
LEIPKYDKEKIKVIEKRTRSLEKKTTAMTISGKLKRYFKKVHLNDIK